MMRRTPRGVSSPTRTAIVIHAYSAARVAGKHHREPGAYTSRFLVCVDSRTGDRASSPACAVRRARFAGSVHPAPAVGYLDGARRRVQRAVSRMGPAHRAAEPFAVGHIALMHWAVRK